MYGDRAEELLMRVERDGMYGDRTEDFINFKSDLKTSKQKDLNHRILKSSIDNYT